MKSSRTKDFTSFDPDYSREGKLVSSDEQEEEEFLRSLFNLFRQGRMDDALSYCSQSKLHWRLVSILGHLAQSLDLNLTQEGDVVDGISGNGILNGNSNYYLWKLCCYKLAESTNSVEAAVYGFLGGHLESVLNQCNENWNDYLWAYLAQNCRNKVDKLVYDAICAQKRFVEELPEVLN